MSQDAWEIFCENLEAELKVALWGSFFTAFVFLGLFLITIIIFANSYSNFEQYGATADPPVGPFVVVPVLFVFIVGGTMCFKAALEYQVRGNLHRICEEESKKYWNLSFHIKEEIFHSYDSNGTRSEQKYHLEIQTGLPATSKAFGKGHSIPAALASAPAKALSPTERLEQLEKIKVHLTTEEYKQKKMEILDSV
jgi:hypothetical protein